MYHLGMTFDVAPSPDRCANCGQTVTTRGRPGFKGRRYCMEKPCRAARARWIRREMSSRQQASTACSGCGGTLSARPHRSGDELGRFCSRPSCQRKKREARAAVAGDVDLHRKAAVYETVIQFLGEVVMADSEDYLHAGRVVCHECGLTTAIREWVHPTEAMAPCNGTLFGAKSRNIGQAGIIGAWPFRREYLTPEQLAAYDD